ncbi:sensor histidine kinase [Aminipila sp.]|uniref:sensor histidine kinase n=1 Tax=Aminipila sp. TaxID=2060095 RepID=UPI00289E0452|nr:GHKL domain-containing protein [Aminipila sp.]
MLIISNYIILKNGLINTYQEKELGIYKRYNPIIQELIEELRGKQHEFDNHLQALKLMLADDNLNENIDTIKNYIKDLEIKNDLGNLIKLDNKILASLLYSKKKKSEEKGTILNIEIKNYMMQFKNYELVEIIGTLIDNALETKVDKNIVYLKIHKENDMNVIEVKNKHPYLSQNVILNMFKKGFSTKSGNRGYGLYNLKNIVNAAKGTIEVSNLKDEIDEENYVAIKIRIN